MLGSEVLASGGVRFSVWAPTPSNVRLRVFDGGEAADFAMDRDADGVWSRIVLSARPGNRYVFVLDDTRARPDPCSRSQPEGVHGPSEIIDSKHYTWRYK